MQVVRLHRALQVLNSGVGIYGAPDAGSPPCFSLFLQWRRNLWWTPFFTVLSWLCHSQFHKQTKSLSQVCDCAKISNICAYAKSPSYARLILHLWCDLQIMGWLDCSISHSKLYILVCSCRTTVVMVSYFDLQWPRWTWCVMVCFICWQVQLWRSH